MVPKNYCEVAAAVIVIIIVIIITFFYIWLFNIVFSSSDHTVSNDRMSSE